MEYRLLYGDFFDYEKGMERRRRMYAAGVDWFKDLDDITQMHVIDSMLEISELTDISFLGLTDSSTSLEKFEQIFKIIPMEMRFKLLREHYKLEVDTNAILEM